MSERPVVLGRYLLCDVIGGGGMAKVHIGRALGAAGFSRVVAIKRLHPERAKDPHFTTMLIDEARLVSRIRHPNVVPTLDVVQVGRELLLVMEYVPGLALSRLAALARARSERIPLAIATRIILDVLLGLSAAHAATSERGRPLEIVHRDVSPQNVIVGTDGVARLVDFGIAKAEGKLAITREGEIRGKLTYMAPEQLGGLDVDRRADLYSTGVMLWELVTGRRLFEHDSDDLRAILEKVRTSTIPGAREYVEVSDALDAVLVRALAADRAARFADAAEMEKALEAASSPATAKEVATFLAALGRAALDQREELVANVEQLSTVHELGLREAVALETDKTETVLPMTAPMSAMPVPVTVAMTERMSAPAAPTAADAPALAHNQAVTAPLPPPVAAAPRRRSRAPGPEHPSRARLSVATVLVVLAALLLVLGAGVLLARPGLVRRASRAVGLEPDRPAHRGAP